MPRNPEPETKRHWDSLDLSALNEEKIDSKPSKPKISMVLFGSILVLRQFQFYKFSRWIAQIPGWFRHQDMEFSTGWYDVVVVLRFFFFFLFFLFYVVLWNWKREREVGSKETSCSNSVKRKCESTSASNKVTKKKKKFGFNFFWLNMNF